MSSWRLDVIKRDRSGTVQADTGVTGAMVIRAERGTKEPVLIENGQESRIIDLFGYPSVNYPDVWEAIEYNQVGELWVSAPSPESDTMGGVAVLDSGVVPLDTGVTTGGIESYTFASTDHSISKEFGEGDATETVFTYTIPYSVTDPTAMSIKVDGVELGSLSISGTDPTYTISATELTTGSYDSSTGVLSIEFVSAPAEGVIISVDYTHSAIPYFVLLSRSPMTDIFATDISWDSVNQWWEFNLYQKNRFTNDYNLVAGSPFTVSTELTKVDGFGASVYIENILDGNDFIRPIVNPTQPALPTVDPIGDVVSFSGGNRTPATVTEYQAGWAEFEKADKYPAEIFMDATCDPAVPALIENIVNNYQKYSYGGIVAVPLGNAVDDAISYKEGLGLSSPDMAVYYNQGKVRDFYNNSFFWTPLVGRIGQRYALMNDIFFAGAPYQSNEDNHGGQLGAGIVELENSLPEGSLKKCDEAGLNPISFKPAYGVMIESMKTAQSPNTKSDYSFVAHRNLFNYLIKNVIQNSLVPQIGKLNNQSHQFTAKNRADLIVNPVLEAGYLVEAAVVCDASNNTDAVLARREFVLDVVVKVTPYSEKVTLRFTNVDQQTSVSAIV